MFFGEKEKMILGEDVYHGFASKVERGGGWMERLGPRPYSKRINERSKKSGTNRENEDEERKRRNGRVVSSLICYSCLLFFVNEDRGIVCRSPRAQLISYRIIEEGKEKK